MLSWFLVPQTILTGLNLQKSCLHSVLCSSAIWDQRILVFKCSFLARRDFFLRFCSFRLRNFFPMRICEAPVASDRFPDFSMLKHTFVCFAKLFLSSPSCVYQRFGLFGGVKPSLMQLYDNGRFQKLSLRFRHPASNVHFFTKRGVGLVQMSISNVWGRWMI